jgi:3-oxoacyl-[acyl-carrier protein] reductase
MGAKSEFAIGKGRTKKAVEQSGMIEPEDVAAVALPACTQSPKSRIIEARMRTMAEPLTG